MNAHAPCRTGKRATSHKINRTVNQCTLTLNVRAFIEGFYIHPQQMQPVLQNAGVSGNNTITDSITIELHNPTAPYAIVSTGKVALHNDGWAQQTIAGTLSGGSFYIIVRSRNGIDIWSKFPVTMGLNTSFDFTAP